MTHIVRRFKKKFCIWSLHRQLQPVRWLTPKRLKAIAEGKAAEEVVEVLQGEQEEAVRAGGDVVVEGGLLPLIDAPIAMERPTESVHEAPAVMGMVTLTEASLDEMMASWTLTRQRRRQMAARWKEMTGGRRAT